MGLTIVSILCGILQRKEHDDASDRMGLDVDDHRDVGVGCSFSERTADARANELRRESCRRFEGAVDRTGASSSLGCMATVESGDPHLDWLAHAVAIDHLRKEGL